MGLMVQNDSEAKIHEIFCLIFFATDSIVSGTFEHDTYITMCTFFQDFREFMSGQMLSWYWKWSVSYRERVWLLVIKGLQKCNHSNISSTNIKFTKKEKIIAYIHKDVFMDY